MEEKIIGSMNVGIYGVISICIFVAFFTSTLIWALLLTNRYLGRMENLPLEDGKNDTHIKTNPEDL